ncbi:MAG: precorrin-3B C(17)-methyltransferase, partial [Pseudomonadota bacterium]
GEEDRCRYALEQAGLGKRVALVCSGDAGIYAMGALVFELLDRGPDQMGVSDAARRVEVVCAPGVSALQAAAARAGAPLGHDFCAISLSDLLTPREDIVKRLHAAAEGDFVIAFYNPVSKRRRTLLAEARDILLAHRPADTPVLIEWTAPFETPASPSTRSTNVINSSTGQSRAQPTPTAICCGANCRWSGPRSPCASHVAEIRTASPAGTSFNHVAGPVTAAPPPAKRAAIAGFASSR